MEQEKSKSSGCKNNQDTCLTIVFFMIAMCILCLLFYAIAFYEAKDQKVFLQGTSAATDARSQ